MHYHAHIYIYIIIIIFFFTCIVSLYHNDPTPCKIDVDWFFRYIWQYIMYIYIYMSNHHPSHLKPHGGVMVSSQIKPKAVKLVFAVSLVSMQHYGVRARTSWIRMRMCELSNISSSRLLFQWARIFLPVDCCFSEL